MNCNKLEFIDLFRAWHGEQMHVAGSSLLNINYSIDIETDT